MSRADRWALHLVNCSPSIAWPPQVEFIYEPPQEGKPLSLNLHR
jgi:hypothetical protein